MFGLEIGTRGLFFLLFFLVKFEGCSARHLLGFVCFGFGVFYFGFVWSFFFLFSFFKFCFLEKIVWVSTQNIKLAGSPKALCCCFFLFFFLSLSLLAQAIVKETFVAVFFASMLTMVGLGTSLMFDASLSSDGADACQAWLLRPATHQPKLSRRQDVCCKYLWSFDLTFPSNFLYYI